MVNVVAVCAGGRHDGGVGDGGAVVAADRTGETGGNAHDLQVGSRVEDRKHDGDEDAEGAPARAGGEGQQAGDHEDDSGQQHEETFGRLLHQTLHIIGGAEETRHALEGDGEGEDQNGGDHGVEALGHAAHSALEGDDTARAEVDDGQDQRDQRTPGQTHKGIGITEGCDEVARVGLGIPEAADIDEADDAEDDEQEDGNEHIPHIRAGGALLLLLAQRAEVAGLGSLELGRGHGTVVHTENDHGDDEHDGEQRVEVIGNGLNEKLNAGHAGVELRGDAGDGGCPRGDRRDHADRRGGGVNEVGELHAGDALAVGHGGHDGADGEAVEVVVDEDEHAEGEGGEQRAGLGMDVARGPAAERGGAAGGVDERDHHAEDHKEEEDAGVVGDGGGQTVVDDGVERADGAEVGGEQGADDDADEEGGVGLLRQQGKADGDDRGNEGPEGVDKHEGFSFRASAQKI